MPSGLAVSTIVAGHLDVGARGRRVAGGMVVDQDHRGRRQLERALDHLARIDRRVVDGAGLLDLVGDQRVLLVEEEDAELLAARQRPWRRGNSRGPPLQDDSTGRLATGAAWRCAGPRPATILRSSATASPTPLTSFSRSRGAPSTSAKEPKRAISALASGLVSRRGIGAEQQQLEQLVVGQGIAPASRKRSRSRSRWPR